LATTSNDMFLLQRYAEHGDAEAFAELMERYEGFVYATCLRVLGNADDAEDVAQECFLRLTRNAAAIRSSVGGWLHTCATSMSVAERHRQTARKHREEVHGQMNSASNSDNEWHEIAPHVDEALEELPEELRVVLTEHFLHRRSPAKAARAISRSSATSKSRKPMPAYSGR